jgi:hypothetical protein
MGFLKSAVNSYRGLKDRLQEKMLIKIFIKAVVPNGNGRASWLNTIVPKKKKLKKFTATSAVKAASRAVLGTPPPVKRVENKKQAKKDKHKPSLGKLLADADRG